MKTINQRATAAAQAFARYMEAIEIKKDIDLHCTLADSRLNCSVQTIEMNKLCFKEWLFLIKLGGE